MEEEGCAERKEAQASSLGSDQELLNAPVSESLVEIETARRKADVSVRTDDEDEGETCREGRRGARFEREKRGPG